MRTPESLAFPNGKLSRALLYVDQSAGKGLVMNEVLISEFAREVARGDAAEATPLRRVVWSDLTARLSAMRDLRLSLARASRGHGANFSSLAADRPYTSSAFTDFADHRDESVQDDSKVNAGASDINPKALADGKGPAPNHSVELNCMTPGDRELK